MTLFDSKRHIQFHHTQLTGFLVTLLRRRRNMPNIPPELTAFFLVSARLACSAMSSYSSAYSPSRISTKTACRSFH